MNRPLPLVLLVACFSACGACESKTSAPTPVLVKADPVSAIQATEARAAERDEVRSSCGNRIAVYSGSIDVAATGYQHHVERGDDYVEEEIGDLDRVITKATRVQFTLDYPFEKKFTGVVTDRVTLRKIIDAVRAGFRKMYEGSTERDIPGMMNKDVSGAYGKSFHAIGDLVIEGIDLCDDASLEISIGS